MTCQSGYKDCACCSDIFVSNGEGDDYCESCTKAECADYQPDCQKPECGCGEHMSLNTNNEWSCHNDCHRFVVGAEVYWNDTDDGACSGTFKIKEIHPAGTETVFVLENEAGSLTEAFIHECS